MGQQTYGSAGSPHLDLLLDALPAAGWSLVEREELPNTNRASFASWLLARREAACLVLCETRVGRAFPGYLERREWRSALRLRHEDILLITDAAHSEFVLTAQIEAASRTLYFEERLAVEADSLRELLGVVLAAHPKSGAIEADMRRDTETSIATSVRASLGERSGTGGPAPTDLIERIVESVDPALIRSLWRGLTRIIVLDPRCDSPVWLLSAAEFLEACYIAILSRMKSSLIDAATTRGPGAYERHLAHPLPFESSDERVEKQLVRPSISVSKVPIAFAGMKLEGLDRTIIRRTIVRRHLVGLASSKSSMTRCRHALLAFTGENRRHFPSLDTNVRQLSIQDPVNGFRSIGSAEVWAEQTGSTEVGKETSNIGAAEEIDAFAHAWSLIIDARDSHEWTVDEWRKTARDLRRLRARLVSRTSNRRATHSQAGDPHFRAVDIDPRLVIPAWETDRHVIVRAA